MLPIAHRRRLAAAVVLGVLLLLVWAAGVRGAAHGAAGTGPVPLPIAARVHIVQPGENAWVIARGVDPGGSDVRRLVDQLEAQHPGPLRVGERLLLPTIPAR